MKKIIIKEIDKYSSQNFRNKTISEYLIYLMEGDVRVSAFTEIGEEAKRERIHMVLLTSFPSTLTKDEYKNYIEEITFEQA
jgi:N-glycosylase/DNA lyase